MAERFLLGPSLKAEAAFGVYCGVNTKVPFKNMFLGCVHNGLFPLILTNKYYYLYLLINLLIKTLCHPCQEKNLKKIKKQNSVNSDLGMPGLANKPQQPK